MKNFEGVFTALITPFRHAEVDYDSLKKLVEFQLEAGIHGFVVNGTTGESPTLSRDEVKNIYRFVRDISGPDFPILVGTGLNCTNKTIEMSQLAESLGATGVLVVTPYYNKPPQRGLVQHFEAVSRSIQIPVMLYNVPGRTITSIAPETLAALKACKNIVGIKEASGDMEVLRQMKKAMGPNFIYSSGDDGTWLNFMELGGHGIISVMSHVFPKQMVDLYNSVSKLGADFAQHKSEFEKYNQFLELLYVEANPIPVKWALYLMHIIDSFELRLPLVHLDPKFQEPLRRELSHLGVIHK